MTAASNTDRPVERTVFGHPIGLVNLFGVELWGRFSFYGMLTIGRRALTGDPGRGGRVVTCRKPNPASCRVMMGTRSLASASDRTKVGSTEGYHDDNRIRNRPRELWVQ
jgi:hypothetical protein